MVDTVDQLSDQATGPGAIRRCNFYDGTSVVEEITTVEQGRAFEVVLSDFSMPLKSATARMDVTLAGPVDCDVTLEMEFQAKGGILGDIMGAVMMRPMMRGMFKKVLAGLEHHVRTGEWIGKNGVTVPAARRAA